MFQFPFYSLCVLFPTGDWRVSVTLLSFGGLRFVQWRQRLFGSASPCLRVVEEESRATGETTCPLHPQFGPVSWNGQFRPRHATEAGIFFLLPWLHKKTPTRPLIFQVEYIRPHHETILFHFLIPSLLPNSNWSLRSRGNSQWCIKDFGLFHRRSLLSSLLESYFFKHRQKDGGVTPPSHFRWFV